jgi:hypothetical protein
MKKLAQVYKQIIESKITEPPPTEIVTEPENDQLRFHGGPNQLLRDSFPIDLLDEQDRDPDTLNNSPLDGLQWIGTDANGNQIFKYKGKFFEYIFLLDRNGVWRIIGKRIADQYPNPSIDYIQGKYGPPYGVIQGYNQIAPYIYIDHISKEAGRDGFYKFNPQTGMYEFVHDTSTIPSNVSLEHLRHYRWDPLLYDDSGNPRSSDWLRQNRLPFWNFYYRGASEPSDSWWRPMNWYQWHNNNIYDIGKQNKPNSRININFN